MLGIDLKHKTKDRRGRVSSGMIWLVVVSVLAAGGVLLQFAIQSAREAAIASASQGPLNQLHLAFHQYHAEYGCFPPAYIADDAGKPMHSWRALILPYIDNTELYKLYDFAEPWNGPKNRQLANRMPIGFFHCPSEPPSDKHTNYVVIVGPDTAFPGSKSTSKADFEDGLDHTILAVEVSNSTIEWLEPSDLNIDTMSLMINDPIKPSISTSRSNGPYILFADRFRTYSVTTSLPADVLRALTTVRGHEPIFMVNVGGMIGGLMSPRSGRATDADLVRFTDWDDVKDVWLNRSRITDEGLAQLRKVPRLRTVHVAHTPITDEGIIQHFAGWKYPPELDLAFTSITDTGLTYLTSLVDLYRLDLNGTQVTVPGVVKLLRSLPNVCIKFSLGTVGHRILELGGSSTDDGDLEHFRGLKELQSVDLSRTNIDDAGLMTVQAWPELYSLDLTETGITDNGLKHLRSLTQLRDLKLSGTKVTDRGIADLKQALPLLNVER